MKNNLPAVYIIVLNWNGSNDTIECIKSIRKNNYPNYTLVIVDNGSEKENLDTLKSWCKSNYSEFVLYSREEAESGGVDHYEEILMKKSSKEKLVFIENNENLGFAAGNNVALKYVLKKNVHYAMLLNNDTVIEENSVNILVNFLISQNDYVAVTPQIRYFEPNDKIWNCGGKIMWYGNRKYYFAGDHISKVPESGYKRITFITGCALFFKPQITGILSENFFYGEEDLEFSFRQKAAKRKMACCYSSIIYHKISASFKKVNASILGSLYIYYLSRLIDNKYYSSTFMFVIKTIMNLTYAILLMIFRYKLRFKQVFIMITTILKELNRIDKITKDYCLRSLKQEFNHPIKWTSKF
ncbi:MAG TPA: glycosyltransferase family 2 protein [Ignavibacteria bacterium]